PNYPQRGWVSGVPFLFARMQFIPHFPSAPPSGQGLRHGFLELNWQLLTGYTITRCMEVEAAGIGGLASKHKYHANAVPTALAVQLALSNADRLPALADNEVAVPSLAAALCTICPVRCVPFLGEQSCAGQDPVQLAPLDVAMLIQRGGLPGHYELASAENT